MTDEKTDADADPKGGDDKGSVSGDASDKNPESDDRGGLSEEELLEKVGAVVKEHTGIDLDEVIKQREKDAAAEAAESAGKGAQKVYDPKIAALEEALKATRLDLKKVKRTTRDARIAAAPEAEKAGLIKLAEAADVAEDAQATIAFANQALRVSKARELALDLREKGLEGVTKETFLDLDSPEAMAERAADMRAEHAEKALKEALKGGKSGETDKKPPAASSKASRKGGGATGAGGSSTGSRGDRSWGEQSKKGLTSRNLAAGLRAMEEADDRGVK